MDSVRYVLALLIVLTLPPSVAWWYILHLFVKSWRKIRPASTILMLLTLGFVSVVSLYSVQGLLIGQDLGANGILAGLGGFLILLSWGIAVLRSRHLTAKTMLGIPETSANEVSIGKTIANIMGSIILIRSTILNRRVLQNKQNANEFKKKITNTHNCLEKQKHKKK